jgi:hypothetical protein
MRTTAAWAAVALVGVAVLFTAGCGGGLENNTGAAEGYLYLPTEGTTALQGFVYAANNDLTNLMVSDSPVAPVGYTPVGGATVSLSVPTGRQVTITNAAGYFVISNLPPGKYIVTITLPNGTVKQFPLTSSAYVVIILPSPNPPPGFEPGKFIILVFPNGVTTQTEPNGYFYAGNLPPGLVTLAITFPDGTTITIPVWIEAGQVHTGGFGQFG